MILKYSEEGTEAGTQKAALSSIGFTYISVIEDKKINTKNLMPMFVVIFKIGNPESLQLIYNCMLPLYRGET